MSWRIRSLDTVKQRFLIAWQACRWTVEVFSAYCPYKSLGSNELDLFAVTVFTSAFVGVDCGMTQIF